MDLTPENITALATSGTTGAIVIVYYVLHAIALWRIFTKAGHAGILALIPIVNAVFLLKIVGLSGWFVLLYIVPVANVVLAIVVALRLGKAFGHGGAFSFFLLLLLAPIGQFIIGFSRDTYTRPAPVS